MGDLTNESDRLLEEARRVRDDNRAGGRHRMESIGQRSADIKSSHLVKKLIQIAIGVVGVFIAAGVAGAILNGIGFWGIMLSVLTIAAVIGVVSTQKVKVPKRADLTKGDVRNMVGKTELWLEHQRPALPPPAVKIVEDMGIQLDSLGVQLETIDQKHPAAEQIRKLVGDILPETVESYRKIPSHLRGEKRAGATPDEQVTESLSKISKEIDSVTRQLAEGSLDDLAIKTRYLEYKYGEDADTSPGSGTEKN
ncbi:hypothetical protein QWY75_08685 [Pontixanthobacter aestiaquae]|uniref:5-bromo-4-chloroindolyl phosphate hydrolysis protein n=1 Tax=Pontixanthobacter aestiaquae TaxID=1509367 RepID=A0A844Z484_9SPHN|nr:hypothetical protein [Pontixanthobacter aestiaquae]MDN3646274.1 hypothetical protein [Pontixanthobacter aestiaquae]MXO82735.1 hypothetical protein [Pontixanthobacter aestiaquae]